MRIQTVLDVFDERVPVAFGYLSEEFGYRLDRHDDYCFVAASEHGSVTIELDWGSVVVAVRPKDAARSVRLSFIVGALDPSVLFLPRFPWGPDEARDEIERQSELLARYCGGILRGDVSGWPLLEAHQQMVLEQWRAESERLVKEARLKLVRRRAEAAFHSRSFGEAEQLYTSIREDLTDEETRRLAYSRRRSVLRPVRPPLEKPA